MAKIRSRDTTPELQIRRLLHAAGLRFRLHRRDLPGTPDIVLPKYKAVVDVRGCYWHAHDCHLFRQPAQNAEFWKRKLTDNLERDLRNDDALAGLGWRQLIVWECALKGRSRLEPQQLRSDVLNWLNIGSARAEIRGDEIPSPMKTDQNGR